MPLSTSNFKRRLRLPRLFFMKPPEVESIHGGPPLEYVRPVPELPWRGITVAVVLIVIAASSAWELYCRSIGYGPTLNDNADLWTSARRRVKPDSTVIIGDSRGWFDLDLNNYQNQLVYGYTRMTPQAGLLIFMPDLDTLLLSKGKQNISMEWMKHRNLPPPPDVTAK